MNTQQVNRWLEPLSSSARGALQLDDQGLAVFELEDGQVCSIELDEDAGLLHLYGVLGPVLPSQVSAVCVRAMEANLYGLGTGGLTLGFHAQRQQLVASQSLLLPALSQESFMIHLQAFVASFMALHTRFRPA